MGIKIACAGLLTASLCSFAAAQHLPLDIGEAAPAIHPESWIKGMPVTEFQKGRVYVVEFWVFPVKHAADRLPNIVDLETKTKGKVQFVGVSCFSQFIERKTFTREAHLNRMLDSVKESDAFMPESVCDDDAKNSIVNQWLPGEGIDRVPRAVIINQQGQVAWIGRPMEMERPLMQIIRGSFDWKAYKEKLHSDVTAQAANRQLFRDIESAAKAGDMVLMDGLVNKVDGLRSHNVVFATDLAAGQDPEFALRYLKSRLNKDKDTQKVEWCNSLAIIITHTRSAETKNEAVQISADLVSKSRDFELPEVEAIHARVLAFAGRKEEAEVFIQKAKSAAKVLHPVSFRNQTDKFVDEISKSIR